MKTDFQSLVELLMQKGYKISAAESCTGGLFAAGIVSVADASRVLDRSFVTYSDNAKIELVGVNAEIIRDFGVVSNETAAAMAEGVCRTACTDVGVGITGFAGPSGGDRFAPLGTVCFGFCVAGKTTACRKDFGDIGRNVIREQSVAFARETLYNLLKES